MLVYLYILERIYRLRPSPDEIHFVKTGDGVTIALFHYVPKGGKSHKEPVLFCHGLGANMHNFDLDREYSPARYLADNGYDTWIVNLRGADVKGIVEYKEWGFDYDDYLKKDIPSAVSYIQDKTSEPRLFWIGHSMGGMLLYSYLLTGGGDAIKGGIAIGSPMVFKGTEGMIGWIIKSRIFTDTSRKLHYDAIARFLTPLTGKFKTVFERYQLNVGNVDFKLIRKAQYNAVTPLSNRLLTQFVRWLRESEIKLSDGFNVTAGLEGIMTPFLGVSGGGDRISSPDNTAYGYDRIQSPDKTHVVLSKKNGFAADYGHIDMLFGRKAREEVYPLLKQWLDARSTADSPGVTV